MEKQTIIRGAAIVVTGIAASTFGAQHLMSGKSDRPVVAQSALTESDSSVVSAGLLGGPTATKPAATDSVVLDSTSFTALTDSPAGATPLAAASDLPAELVLADSPEPGLAQDDCTPELVVRTAIDALIELSLTAPCHADERLVVSHADLAFSAYTSGSGAYSAFIPALQQHGKVDVFLGEDVFLSAEAEVPDLADHSRVVLQWTGDARFGLHAYHRGAGYGDDGHMHALRPFDPMLDEAFLVSLGERRGPEPMLAEIYSVPAGRDLTNRIELELSFDATQCGEEQTAYILHSGAGIGSEIKEARLATPDCPGQGGTVVMALPTPQMQRVQLSSSIGRPLSELVD